MKINYLLHTGKKNPTIIFLHGLGGNLYAWKEIEKDLHKKGYPTLRIDLRGHGESTRPKKTEQYKLELFAKDLNKIIKDLKIKNFIIVGHCFGGVIATIYQNKYKKAKALVLISSTHKAPKRLIAFKPFLFLANDIFGDYLPEDFDTSRKDFSKYISSGDLDISRIKSDINNTGIKSYLACFYHLSKYRGEELLKQLDVPVEIIAGEKDTIFYEKYPDKIKKLISKSYLTKIPNANHLLILGNYKRIATVINDFIKDSSLDKLK